MPIERLSPMSAIRQRKVLAAVLVVLCIAAGLGVALIRPTVYTAEARLAVGGNAGLAAEAVPGYALASQQLAANYSRYVNNAQGQAALEAQLGIHPGIVETVSASPIPESNIVRVEVTARIASTAKGAVNDVANALMRQVNDTSRVTAAANATLDQYTGISGQVAAAQQESNAANAAVARASAQSGGAADLPQLTEDAANVAARLAILQVQQEALGQKYRNQVAALSAGAANLIVVEKPVVAGDNRVSQMGQFALAGLVGGVLLALIIAVGLERRRSSRTNSEEGQPSRAGAAEPGSRPRSRERDSALVETVR